MRGWPRQAGFATLRPFLLILATACFVSACISVRPIYVEEEKKTAERAAEQIHARLNAGEYEAVYDESHAYFKEALPDKEKTVAEFRQGHEETGRIVRIKERLLNYVPGTPAPVRVVYNLECEKGDYSEWMSFVITKDGKNALLAHYRIFHGSSPITEVQTKMSPER
jgi:hypothetical protein